MKSIILLLFFLLILKNSQSQILQINEGSINGIALQSRKGVTFNAFRGIFYAEPPIGELRFQPPVAKANWSGVFDATNYGSKCVQIGSARYNSEEIVLGVENCLTLNVFTKNINHGGNLKPVIVFFHGGGFEIGSSVDHHPNYLMDRDILLVTVNYRLGPLGFLAIGHKDATGNMGLKDQNLALKWVQRNIHHFGGNPQRVTISGLSAGSYSSTAHMASEMSRGLFHGVIAISGAITWQIRLKSDGINEANKLSQKLNCTTDPDMMVECLRSKSAEDIFRAYLYDFYGCPIMPWVPVVEPDFGQERFLTEEPNEIFKSGNFTKVPIIAGITANEFGSTVQALLESEEAMRLLNQDFSSIASECFFFADNGVRSTSEIGEIFRSHYFPFSIIDGRSFNNLNQLSADGVIGYGVHRLVNFVSQFVDAFYYQFTFVGRFSIFNYPRDTPYGANHVDDLQYVLVTDFIGPEIQENDPENVIVERMTRIWEQFAWTGNPNNPNDEYLSTMNWPKHDALNQYYLDIGNNMIEKQGLNLKRYKVWNDLEVSAGSFNKMNAVILVIIIIVVMLIY